MPEQICNATDVSEKGREFRLEGKKGPVYLMIFRCGERIVAYHNVCPHENKSLNWAPNRFMVGDDGLLVCAHHGAAFDLDSGECLQGPCKGKSLRPCAVSIRDGVVWVD
jgi:nitrite reductase/ring-hydroxylating ferredoxin subunit